MFLRPTLFMRLPVAQSNRDLIEGEELTKNQPLLKTGAEPDS
jgi:hypothetical protein